MSTLKPTLRRLIVFGDTDSDGDVILAGTRYLEEGLVKSGAGDYLLYGSTELLTLNDMKMPMTQSSGSASGLTAIEMEGGTILTVHHRTFGRMKQRTWGFSFENIDKTEEAKIKRFLDKIGNHQRVLCTDPYAIQMYGKMSGDYSIQLGIRGSDMEFTITEEPGATSL